MRSAYGRADVPHLGNTTNIRYECACKVEVIVYTSECFACCLSRLEAASGHLKDVLKSTTTLDEC
ncbi:hypothetical protein JG687_00016679, partial [Phytophthora cactorum]